MSPMQLSARPQRRLLCLALLSALATPAVAGTTCQLFDDSGAILPIDSSAVGAEALACGPDAKATGDGSTAIGDETTATGKNATAVGSWIDLDGDGLVDPDEITWARGVNATALGAASQAPGNGAVALGVRSVANLDNSVAIGSQAQTQAVGTSTVTTREGAARSGSGTVVTTSPPTPLPASGSNSMAMGSQARVNGDNSIVIGPSASAEKVTNLYSVAASPAGSKETQMTMVQPVKNTVVIGNAARANGDGITVIGAGALAERYSRAPLNGFGGPYVLSNVPVPATNSTVVGSGAVSRGINNVVLGSGATTSGDSVDATGTIELKDQNSTVVGYQAATSRGWGSAFGYHAIAYGHASTAIGTGTYAVGTGSTAVGGWFDVNAAFGGAPVSTPPTGFAFGTNTPGMASQAFGANARTWGNYDTALGPAARTSDFNSDSGNLTRYSSNDPKVINGSIAVGFVAFAEGRTSMAIGQQSRAHDSYAIAIGSQSVAWGSESLALGNAAIASWTQDVAIGDNAQALGGFGTGNIALGTNALVDEAQGGDASNAIAFGTGARAMADDATAFGHDASATAAGALAVGNASAASGASAAAFGGGAMASGEYADALGSYAYASGDYALAAGTNAFAMGLSSTAVGYNSYAAGDDSVAFGSYAIADEMFAAAFGTGAKAEGQASVALGNTSIASGAMSTALGSSANARTTKSIAIGTNSIAAGELSTVIGSDAEAQADNSVALGAGSIADRANTVSVGIAGGERQIANVAAGTEDTDAVNVAQLNTALDTVGGTIGDLDDIAVKYDDASTRDKVTLDGTTGTTIANLRAGLATNDAVNVGQLRSVINAFGGGATFDGNGMMTLPTFQVLGARYSTVTEAFAALGAGITGLRNRLTLVENHLAGPHTDVPIGTGSGLAIGEGSVAVSANDTAIGTGANVHADGSTAVGSNATIGAAASNAVAIGADARVTAESGTAIGQGATVSANNSVALGQGAIADEANTVSVGNSGNTRRVTNVAAGVNANDGVSVQQMQTGDAQAVTSANAYTDNAATQAITRTNAYTDSRYQGLSDEFTNLKNDLGYRLGRQDERIDRQGAMSAAMMNMSINAANSRSPRGRIAVGAGWQNGESAMSVGYSKAIGDRASFSIGGAFSSDDSSAGIGFGVDL